MSRRIVVLFLLACTVVGIGDGFAAQDKPNIIVILADDLGYGDIACFGHPENLTPHLDQLASEGLKFTDFHANGPMCSPTRAAFLTGLYQNRFGPYFESALSAERPSIGLPPHVPTIPALLKEAGYATGMYGKWHLGYAPPHTPPHFGFDDFRGLLTGDGDHVSQISRSGTEDWYHNDTIAMEEGYTAELITDHSIDFIREHQDEPFFLFMSHLAIHFPWQAPGEDAHRVVGEDYWNLSKLGPHPEGQVKPVVKDMVESLDKSVGTIMAELRRLGLDKNTVVVFTSDNGGYLNYSGQFAGEISSNGPYRGQKTQVWEGGHRVPAIVWWPGRVQPGVSDETALTMDLLPTFMEVAGSSTPAQLDGISLFDHWVNRQPLPTRDVIWRADDEWAIRRGPWKLIGVGRNPKLYNLDDDPGESDDLWADHPERRASLLEAYRTWESNLESDGIIR
jgi:arylsulfatase A